LTSREVKIATKIPTIFPAESAKFFRPIATGFGISCLLLACRHDLGAFALKGPGDLFADAARGVGDDRNFA
jgi:hypothetical protein